MQRFYAASFAAALGSLTRSAEAVNLANTFGVPGDDNADRQHIRHGLSEAEQALADLPVSRVIQHQFDRLKKAADGNTGGNELSILIREFHNNLMVELTSAWFLMIPAERRDYYEQLDPAFGPEVATAFDIATADIAAASRCYALDEWTACVFHLMRTLEHGLKKLAAIAELPPEAAAHENWKNIIDQIERKIRDMEQLPKSPEKVTRLQTLSEAAAQFRWFKDAWRNHVSHGHASYDMHSGPMIWTHVRAFMQQLAAL